MSTQWTPTRPSWADILTLEVAGLTEETRRSFDPSLLTGGVPAERVGDAIFKYQPFDGCVVRAHDEGEEGSEPAVRFTWAVPGTLDRHGTVMAPEMFANDPQRAADGLINFFANHQDTLGTMERVGVDDYAAYGDGVLVGSASHIETIARQVERGIWRQASFGFIPETIEKVSTDRITEIYGPYWAPEDVVNRIKSSGKPVGHITKGATFDASIVSRVASNPYAHTEGMRKDPAATREAIAAEVIRAPVVVADLVRDLDAVDVGALDTEERAELGDLVERITARIATTADVRSAALLVHLAAAIKGGTP